MFCPGVVVATVTGGPPAPEAAVTTGVGSTGTSYIVKVAPPVTPPESWKNSVYVPAAGIGTVSRNAPSVASTHTQAVPSSVLTSWPLGS